MWWKRLEEWGIALARFSESLGAKVFLALVILLVLTSLLIVGMMMILLPKSYTVVESSRISDEIDALVAELAQTKVEDAGVLINDFCRDNHAVATLNAQRYGHLDSGKETLTAALEVSFADRPETTLLSVSAPVSASRELGQAFLELLPMVLVVIIVVSAGGAFVCSRALVRPVLALNRTAGCMAALDLDARSDLHRRDELGALSERLNTMAARLQQTMQRLEDDKAQLRVLSEQQRAFFAAASHELKTPLTILRGQLESMQLGLGRYQDPQAVLPETLAEVARMEALVQESLAITKLDVEGSGQLEEVFLAPILREVLQSLRPLAERRRIKESCRLDATASVMGNRALLAKALHNILNNAIRHAPSGARVDIVLTPEQLVVTNSDTNIPETALPKLFTPFYRVDASRNQASGGSGLGLYLTAIILDLHGLTYSLSNSDNGVRFVIAFSENQN